jgi:hypothetical protein
MGLNQYLESMTNKTKSLLKTAAAFCKNLLSLKLIPADTQSWKQPRPGLLEPQKRRDEA